MKYFSGIPVSNGIAFGKAFTVRGSEINVKERRIQDSETDIEIERFNSAVEKAREDIKKVKSKVTSVRNLEHARIFDAHLMILEDAEVIGKTQEIIRSEKFDAPCSLRKVVKTIVSGFEKIKDDYLKSRVQELLDVERRVLDILIEGDISGGFLKEIDSPVILVAQNLYVSDIFEVNKENILGILTEAGGVTSHTAIISRAMGVPAIVGIKDAAEIINSGTEMILDGIHGELVVKPGRKDIKHYKRIKDKFDKGESELFDKLRDVSASTLDGKKVELAANIEMPQEAETIKQNGAVNVGLFRSEFLFINAKKFPSEEKQYRNYRYIAEKASPGYAVIRTVDLGGDKMPKTYSAKFGKEENPVMGWRAIRLCLQERGIFKTQIRAILRASAHGNVRIMFPMISSFSEWDEAVKIVKECKGELRKEKKKFDTSIKTGMMVEIPSVAANPSLFAKKADFFSIGTNDLVQFMMAADRGNDKVAYLYNYYNPSVLALIKNVIDVAHENGVWVGICGEMASDPYLALLLTGMGIDELSMSPSRIADVKALIRSVSYNQVRTAVSRSLSMIRSGEIKRYMEQRFGLKIRDRLPI
ncbi:MAG: phosphoenolpyruvate--protein phosphotransferase [Fibrobacterota bacterium]